MTSNSFSDKNSNKMENKENQSIDDDLFSIKNFDCETNNKNKQNDLNKNIHFNIDKSEGTTSPNTNELFNQSNNPKPNPKIIITNMVFTYDLGCKLNPLKIAQKYLNTEYKKGLNMTYMYFKDPKGTINISKNGKIFCTGVTTLFDSIKIFERFIEKLKLNKRVEYEDVKIANIMATCDVHFKINLTKLNEKLDIGKYHYYDTEIFSGLRLFLETPKQYIGIFNSGKIKFNGFKNKTDLRPALDKIYQILLDCKNTL